MKLVGFYVVTFDALMELCRYQSRDTSALDILANCVKAMVWRSVS